MSQNKNSDKCNDTFPTRLKDLINKHKTTITALAKYVGISRQAVSQYQDGTTQPNVDTIIKIAEYFKVSTDYLLGISDYLTTDNEVKFVCEYTGLNEETINYFHSCVIKSMEDRSTDIMSSLTFIDVLSKKIQSNTNIVSNLINLRKFYKELSENNEESVLDLKNDFKEMYNVRYILNGEKYSISKVLNDVIDEFSTYPIKEFDKNKMEIYSNQIYLFSKQKAKAKTKTQTKINSNL